MNPTPRTERPSVRSGTDFHTWAYVRDLLEKISSGFPQRRIDELLPDAWGLLHAEARLRRLGRRTGRLSPRALAPPRHPVTP